MRIVITGAPCSGKTVTCDDLAQLGYLVIPEAARQVIREIRAERGELVAGTYEQEVNDRVLALQLEREGSIPADMDAICDRGIGDFIAYRKIYQSPPIDDRLVQLRSRYHKAILLAPLPFSPDNERPEYERDLVQYIEKAMREAYESIECPIVTIPVASREVRLKQIIDVLDASTVRRSATSLVVPVTNVSDVRR
jgi:predicted ATPase